MNQSASALGRFSSLRGWLSQWSYDHAQFDSVDSGPRITVPAMVMTAGADDACPPEHTEKMFDALGSADKAKVTINQANHYFTGHDGKAHLSQAVGILSVWLSERGLVNDTVRAATRVAARSSVIDRSRQAGDRDAERPHAVQPRARHDRYLP